MAVIDAPCSLLAHILQVLDDHVRGVELAQPIFSLSGLPGDRIHARTSRC
jgi:hypothetical protein